MKKILKLIENIIAFPIIILFVLTLVLLMVVKGRENVRILLFKLFQQL